MSTRSFCTGAQALAWCLRAPTVAARGGGTLHTLASGCADGSVPGATGITVNAIHVYVLAFPNPLGLHADLIVSSAHCDAGAVP